MFSLIWRWPFKALLWLMFGRVRFAEREEYQEFRYKLLMVLMTSGGLVTGLLVWGSLAQVNPIHPSHQASMIGFTSARKQAIVDLLNHAEVRSQTELSDLLAARGVHVTQATLSRDLVELDLRGGDVIEQEERSRAGAEDDGIELVLEFARREIRADVGVGRFQLVLGLQQVGATLQQVGRQTGRHLFQQLGAQRQASAVSLASAGRTTSRPGMARSAARCSIGWWVGPSSPRPTESWVHT